MLLLQGAFQRGVEEGALHTRRYPSHLAVPERQKQKRSRNDTGKEESNIRLG